MIERDLHLGHLLALLAEFPVVGLIGARQVGKTTLARQLASAVEMPVTHFDLESSRDLGRLQDPLFALEGLKGLVILDEVQLRPELFPTLRVLVDRVDVPARFLVLGSASPKLLKQSSESLAGRIAYHELGGLSLGELGQETLDRLWLRGGFPRSYLAASEGASRRWREHFIRTYLERDLSDLGIRLPAATLRRFWSMMAAYHGDLWNASELSRAFGVAQKTVTGYLDTLCSTFMARRLNPWFSNLAKRQVKAPKIYISDSGLVHTLLGIRSRDDLLSHPKRGASWEGFVIQVIVDHIGARPEECFFWAVHTGAELDLLIQRGGDSRGFEIKLTTSPHTTRSMHSACENLKLDELVVVHAGSDSYSLSPKIRAVALKRLHEDVEPLDDD